VSIYYWSDYIGGLLTTSSIVTELAVGAGSSAAERQQIAFAMQSLCLKWPISALLTNEANFHAAAVVTLFIASNDENLSANSVIEW